MSCSMSRKLIFLAGDAVLDPAKKLAATTRCDRSDTVDDGFYRQGVIGVDPERHAFLLILQ